LSGSFPSRDLSRLLPHREPARFVREILDCGSGAITCLGDVPADSPYVSRGTFPSFVLLDLCAQCAAVLEVVEAMRQGAEAKPTAGYIVRARGIETAPVRQPAGVSFEVRVRRTGRAGELHVYEAAVTAGGAAVFRGSFSTFVGATPGPSTRP